jgi:F5/8 type C domain
MPPNSRALAYLLALLAPVLLPSAARAAVNVASAREGAQVLAASSSQSPQFDAKHLIDGDPETSWATAEGKTTNQWAIVKLAGGRAIEIGSIAIDNTPTGGHAPEFGVRDLELEASTGGRSDEDFYRVDLFSCHMAAGRQAFTFAPVRAKLLRLKLRRNFGRAGFIEVNELEVFPSGAAPTERPRTPAVLLYAASNEPTVGPFSALVSSLLDIGAGVTSFPGDKPGARLTPTDLLGIGAVIVTGEPRLSKGEVSVLDRFVRRGGGVVCALPTDPSPLEPLLAIWGITASGGTRGGAEFERHWTTEGLAAPALPSPASGVAREGAAPLVRVRDTVVALAATVDGGRAVVLPAALLASAPDMEFARRVVLWAAGMEDGPTPAPQSPEVRLSGRGLLLSGGGPEPPPTFARLQAALSERGLRITETPRSLLPVSRSDLADASLVVAYMPTGAVADAREADEWVRGGGRLLALGDPNAPAAAIMQVNQFLREFGVATASAPAQRLATAVHRHPATVGIEALSRPGDILGVWSFQGTTLAEMADTPVAIALTPGEGRLIVMDAGFAFDPTPPPLDRKKPSPSAGIQLQQNEAFVLQCVAWLLGAL